MNMAGADLDAGCSHPSLGEHKNKTTVNSRAEIKANPLDR